MATIREGCEVYEVSEVPEGEDGTKAIDASDASEEPKAPEASKDNSLMDEAVQVTASVGWTPMAAESVGWLSASFTADRLEDRLSPGIRICETPARAARSNTAARSRSKFSRSK